MNKETTELAVLDTNILVHLVREDDTGKAIEAEHQFSRRPERPILSTIVEGEVLALARYLGWGAQKLAKLKRLLGDFVRVDAGMPEIVEAYAELHAEATRDGKPRGENDLWIAATAKAIGGALYTCNSKHFEWMAPEHITVHGIEQTG